MDHLSWVLLLSTWIRKQIWSMCTGRKRRAIRLGQKWSLSPCIVVWFRLVLFCSQKESATVISSQLTSSFYPITNSNSSILEKVKTISMIQMTKIDKHLRWQQSEVPLNIYHLFCGRPMLSMEVQGLPSTTYTNQMCSVLDWFSYNWH